MQVGDGRWWETREGDVKEKKRKKNYKVKEERGEFKTLRVSSGDKGQEKTIISTRMHPAVSGGKENACGEIVGVLLSY